MNYQYISEQSQLDKIIPDLMQRDRWGFDTETTGLDPHINKVILVQIGDTDIQYLIDPRKVSIEPLREFFESELARKIGHNLGFDWKMMMGTFGFDLNRLIDTYLGDKILNVGRKWNRFGLAAVLFDRLGIEVSKEQQKSFIGHTGDFTTEQLEYAAGDVIHLVPLASHIGAEAKRDNLVNVWKLECEAIPCFAELEYEGMTLNVPAWQALIKDNQEKSRLMVKEMDKIAVQIVSPDLFGGTGINYASPKQVLSLLQKMGFKVPHYDYLTKAVKKLDLTDTGDATLSKITKYPIVKSLQKFRTYQKMVGTYGQTYIDAIHPATGRIHPRLDQLGAETGRVAARGVSPITIPRDVRYRNAFIAREGYVIETDDYSGCEMRIIAELSQDPKLCKAFIDGEDIHCSVASELFGVGVTKKNEYALYRQPAKGLNFGLAYGMGVKKLYEKLNAEGYEISFDESRVLFRKYEQKYPYAIKYLREQGKFAIENGYVANANGRRRYFNMYEDMEEWRYKAIEREGGNMSIQSLNVEMTKLAMVKIRRYAKKNGIYTRLYNAVHDEVVTETRADQSAEFVLIKRRLMVEAAQVWIKTIPMEVDGNVLPYWTK